MRRAPLPPNHVEISTLIGRRAVTPQQADSNRSRPLSYARRAKPAEPGLVPFDATELWQAIAAGEFPAPVRGAFGVAWKLDDVYRWRRHNLK